MPRTPYRLIVRDDDGPVLINARVFPRLVGTATPLPDAFPAATGGVAAQSFVTNAQGEAQFWTDAYREDIDAQVTDNGGAAFPPGGIAGTFASYTETIQVPAPNGTLARVANLAVNAKETPYNTPSDGVADATAGATSALAAGGTGPVTFPLGTYLTGALVLPSFFSKVLGLGAILKPLANNQSLVTLKRGSTLQSGDYSLVRDLAIEAGAKTGITGVDSAGASGSSVASAVLENIYAANCDTCCFNFHAAQFIRTYNLRAALGLGVGMLIANDTVAGGGNSHDHYGFQAVQKEVGVVVNGTRFAGGVHSVNFYNPQVLSNSVCGMAFFAANVSVYGGAPELNASGAATKVIDGQTVKRSSYYLNNSTARFCEQHIAEATADPVFLLENASVLTLEDVSGYGAGGLLVSCDATSSVHLKGVLDKPQGVIQGIASWPTGWVMSTSQLVMYGEALHSLDTSLPVLYSSVAVLFSPGGANPPVVALTEDDELGWCNQATFSAVAGSVNNNLVSMAVGTGVASRETVISVLVKSATDTTIGINFHDGAAFNGINTNRINLKAGKVTRLVYGKKDLPAGAWTLYWYAVGTDAPAVKFAALQVYQGAAGQTTRADIARIVSQGSFQPGPLRATQAQLRSLTADVNTKAKFPGKQVWDSTNNRVVFAADYTASNVWKDGVNTTVHTPI